MIYFHLKKKPTDIAVLNMMPEGHEHQLIANKMQTWV